MLSDMPASKTVSMSACGMSATDIRSNGPGTPVIPCGDLAIATGTFACVHEHVDRVRLCPGCAVEIQRAGGLLVCEHCEDGPRTHECMVMVVIDWDGGKKTVVQDGRDSTGGD